NSGLLRQSSEIYWIGSGFPHRYSSRVSTVTGSACLTRRHNLARFLEVPRLGWYELQGRRRGHAMSVWQWRTRTAMSLDDRSRPQPPRSRLRRLAKGLLGALGPSERSILTREGLVYFGVSFVLLVAGLVQQVNLILLVFTLAAGPFLASIFGGRSML